VGRTPAPDAGADRSEGGPAPSMLETGERRRRARRARLTPQPHDGWTFVVVPPGAHSKPRTLRLSVRRLRAVAAAFAASMAMTLVSGAILVLLVATLPPLTAQREGVELGVFSATADSALLPEPEAVAQAGDVVESEPPPTVAVVGRRPGPSRPGTARRTESPAVASAPEMADMSGLPVLGRITSRFSASRRHPMLGVVRKHAGVDIAAPAGTPITAPRAGRVHFVGRKIGYGIVVELDHGNGVLTRYAHCRSASVEEGDIVHAGQQIATVGATGLATGPHLHFEVLVNGRNVNPLTTSLASLFPPEPDTQPPGIRGVADLELDAFAPPRDSVGSDERGEEAGLGPVGGEDQAGTVASARD
jgi:murein DD-endopeptidase MepM/ murein hydrolase activator NlpD